MSPEEMEWIILIVTMMSMKFSIFLLEVESSVVAFALEFVQAVIKADVDF